MADQKLPYSPGLDGVIAGESSICSVDPDAGLHYRGYDVEELARKVGFEQVAWLLLHGELPAAGELADFKKELAAAAALPKEAIEMLRCVPRTARPMDVLRTGVSMLAALDPDIGHVDHAANVRKSVRLLAWMTSVTTAGWRLQHGQEPIFAGDLSLAGRILMELSGKRPPDWQEKVVNAVYILYAEHEFNASTFAARVTASTLADMYAAIVSAIGTLEGTLHGGANETAMAMLRDIGSEAAAEAWVKQRLARKEKIMGFGHRVYKHGDSRVPMMRSLLDELSEKTGQHQWPAICRKLEAVLEQEKGLFANLDLYAAPVLDLLGIPVALNTPLFACARVSGWCAHVIEQQDHNRIIRPRCLYNGKAARGVPGSGS
jgi:2-methylcitrate synthase/citrate synthase II